MVLPRGVAAHLDRPLAGSMGAHMMRQMSLVALLVCLAAGKDLRDADPPVHDFTVDVAVYDASSGGVCAHLLIDILQSECSCVTLPHQSVRLVAHCVCGPHHSLIVGDGSRCSGTTRRQDLAHLCVMACMSS